MGKAELHHDLKAPVAEADAVLIAVGTSSRRSNGHADLSYVHAAAREIAAALSAFTVVVTKKLTVPVGTGAVERLILRKNGLTGFSNGLGRWPLGWCDLK